MKARVLLLALLLCGCSRDEDLGPFGSNAEGYEELQESLAEAWPQSAAVTYKSDAVDYWQSPHETQELGTGDCEDIATLLVYLLGSESSLLILVAGEEKTAAVLYRGEYLEPQGVGVCYSLRADGLLGLGGAAYSIDLVVEYEKAMQLSTEYGRK